MNPTRSAQTPHPTQVAEEGFRIGFDRLACATRFQWNGHTACGFSLMVRFEQRFPWSLIHRKEHGRWTYPPDLDDVLNHTLTVAWTPNGLEWSGANAIPEVAFTVTNWSVTIIDPNPPAELSHLLEYGPICQDIEVTQDEWNALIANAELIDGTTPWQSTAYTIYNEQGQPV